MIKAQRMPPNSARFRSDRIARLDRFDHIATPTHGLYQARAQLLAQPRDEDRIARNKAKKEAEDKKKGKKGKRNGKTKKDNLGRPLKLNKKGAYVVDQKKYKAMKASQQDQDKKEKSTREDNQKKFDEAVDALKASAEASIAQARDGTTSSDTTENPASSLSARFDELKEVQHALFAPVSESS